MRVSNNKSRTVLVMCPNPVGGGVACPRLILTNKDAKLKDDYKGKLRLNKKLSRFI